MNKKNPYEVIVRKHVTEKTQMLSELHSSESNRCTKRCNSPKFVFIVDPRANKKEIAEAVEEIYSERKVKVMNVNTINVRGKPRRVRGRKGFRPSFKKAVVTLEAGDSIEEI